jgi:hypothetical protein
MAYSVLVDYNLSATVRETLATGVVAAAAPTIIHNGFNSQGTLSSTSTPPVTKMAAFEKALAAGTGTIDLTALTGTAGVAVDGTGLKVQVVKIKNPSTNTGALTIIPAVSNGYNFLGAASKIILNPGEEIEWIGYDSSGVPDIASGAKNLTLTGTGTEVSDWVIVMG